MPLKGVTCEIQESKKMEVGIKGAKQARNQKETILPGFVVGGGGDG